jgi:hypothetical protein
MEKESPDPPPLLSSCIDRLYQPVPATQREEYKIKDGAVRAEKGPNKTTTKRGLYQ